ncbi:MAG: DNA primase [Spirochaetia bacterium]|nr:DNA primase [Spirochaetia bacterium]
MKLDILESACRFFESHLKDELREYLFQRYGLSAETIRRYRIGYAPPDIDSFLLSLSGYSPEELINSGLIYRRVTETSSFVRPLFRGRIIFPYLVEGSPRYFIGRATDDTPSRPDSSPPKYVKQIVTGEGYSEPLFGSDTVLDDEPLLITEGITDAIACQQACFPTISPVTTQFKEARIRDAIAHCKRASRVFIINDAEENHAGERGAAKTALSLMTTGALSNVYIGIIPRPEGVDKVDMNDYIRNGGQISDILDRAVPAMDHPAVIELNHQAATTVVTRLRTERGKTFPSQNKYGRKDDLDELKMAIPSITQLSGVLPGQSGVHPIHGSQTGKNFHVSRDGETWTSYHGGPQQGRSGNVFKLIALMEGFLLDEDLPLRGEAFTQTIRYCKEKWG